MTATDVLVVGGGPAGSSLARALVRLGLGVVVLDKRTFPRHKSCAGWITPAVIELLDLDLAEYGSGRVLQPIHAFRVGVIGGNEIETRASAEPISYGIRRWELDHYLLQRSQARLRLCEPLRELRREAGGWRVNGDLSARLLVGAGGHFCPVARHLGALVGREEPAVLAMEIEVEMTPSQAASCQVEAEVPQLFFCRDLQGYGWAFRKENWLNIGLGREGGQRLAEHVEAFRNFLTGRGRIPRLEGTHFRGHAYRLATHRRRKVYDDAVLLIGDAAGLAYPRSGEGIRPAVESAAIASAVISAANRDYGSEHLAPYVDFLRARFGPGQARRSSTNSFLDPIQRAGAHRLLTNGWFARRIVQDRWFLRLHQQKLTL